MENNLLENQGLQPNAEQPNGGEPQNPPIEETENLSQEQAVVADMFGDNIDDLIKPTLEETIPQEYVEALKYKQIIDANPFLAQSIEAIQAGVDARTFYEQVTQKPYSENEPQRLYFDSMKQEFPDISNDDLTEAYEEFLNGRDEASLSPNQKLTLRTLASKLNANMPKAEWKNPFTPPSQEDLKALQELEAQNQANYAKEMAGFRIMADSTGEGGYVITADDIKKSQQLLTAMSKGKGVTNPDGTISKLFNNIVLRSVIFEKALATIASSSNSEGVVSTLKQKANLSSSAQGYKNIPDSMAKDAKKPLEELFRGVQSGLASRQPKHN